MFWQVIDVRIQFERLQATYEIGARGLQKWDRLQGVVSDQFGVLAPF